MSREKSLPLTEDLDFSYLLGLMRPLYDIDEYAWLPELFAIIGHEKLVDLCKYAGGEVIAIPTLDELSKSISSLQYFYDVYISRDKNEYDIPFEYRQLVSKIKEIYDVRDSEEIYKKSSR